MVKIIFFCWLCERGVDVKVSELVYLEKKYKLSFLGGNFRFLILKDIFKF